MWNEALLGPAESPGLKSSADYFLSEVQWNYFPQFILWINNRLCEFRVKILKYHMTEKSLKFTRFHYDYHTWIVCLPETFSGTNQVTLAQHFTTLESETISAQWSVAPRNKTVQTSCSGKQNYVFCSEKQKQRDVVVFLLLLRFIQFASCKEMNHSVHLNDYNRWHPSYERYIWHLLSLLTSLCECAHTCMYEVSVVFMFVDA